MSGHKFIDHNMRNHSPNWVQILIASVVFFPALLQPAIGSDFSGKSFELAMDAVHQHLKKQGSGLVERYENCPENDQTEWGFKFLNAVELKPVDRTRSAILIHTNQCSGGNENGQFLVIASSSSAGLILKNTIGDMRFLIDNYFVGEGVTLELQGVRWTKNDPHCCPSQKGTLSYNIDTGATRYKPNQAGANE